MPEDQVKEPKKFYVSFEFPELPSARMNYTWHGEATNLGMALLRAYQDVRRREGVKKRRLHKAKVSIVEMSGGEGS